jgi:predicted DNA-binding protein with PD1-like motif
MKKAQHFSTRLAPVALALPLLLSCGEPRGTSGTEEPVVRWLAPAEVSPHGEARGAKLRLVSSQPDGAKSYVLILSKGDEVMTALADFARDQKVVNAHFVGIGGVRDPEVAWFDLTRKEFKTMSLAEQMEVLTMSGDIALAESGQPIVHAHLALGRSNGKAWGGHLLHAVTSPTLELYVTTFPQPLYKRADPDTGILIIDPSLVR